MAEDFLDAASGIRDPQTYAIIGAAMEVHRVLGHGFLEKVYQEAMTIEMGDRNLPFEREVRLVIDYKGRKLSCKYQADFIVFGEVIVEIKAQSALTDSDHSQAVNYLSATGYHRALIINFGAPSLQWKRVVVDY